MPTLLAVAIASALGGLSRHILGGVAGSLVPASPAKHRETTPRGSQLPFQLGNPRLLDRDCCLLITNQAHDAHSAADIGANPGCVLSN